MSTNTEPLFFTKNRYINDFNDGETSSNISDSDLSLLKKKLDNINNYLNILTIEVNEIKKYIKKNSYKQPTHNIVLPTYQNKIIPFYQEPNSQYDFNPDIIFK